MEEYSLYALVFIPKGNTHLRETRIQFVCASSKFSARLSAEFDEETETFYDTREVITR